MKYYSCPICHREKFYRENMVMVLCPACMEKMELIIDETYTRGMAWQGMAWQGEARKTGRNPCHIQIK